MGLLDSSPGTLLGYDPMSGASPDQRASGLGNLWNAYANWWKQGPLLPALQGDKNATQQVAMNYATGMMVPIKAYHGSPYDFNQFDLSKIGTGEGAQAYGHGLYFAGNEATAQTYRDFFRGRGGRLVQSP